MLSVTAHARFIAPMDLRPFFPGLRRDGRISLPHPAPDRRRVLLISPPRGLLRGESPTLQILSAGPNGHPQRQLLLNEFADRPPRPEREGELPLIRRLIGDHSLQSLLLLRAQVPRLARLWSASARREDRGPMLLMLTAPAGDSFEMHPKGLSHCSSRLPRLSHPDRLPS